MIARQVIRPPTITTRERALGVGADAGRKRGGKQAERGDQRGHHDRPQPQDRGFADRFAERRSGRGAAR